MAVTLANKVSLEFLAGVSFDASTIGVNHTTPASMRHTLGPLAAITYKQAFFRVYNDSDAAIEATLDGLENIITVSVAAGASASVEVDVGKLTGSEAISASANVTTAGSGTGNLYARLDIEQPLVVSGC